MDLEAGVGEQGSAQLDGPQRCRAIALASLRGDRVRPRTGRRVRAELSQEIAQAIGAERARELASALADVLEARGAMDTIQARRVRPVP